MLLITLERSAADCRVELDGVDISKRLSGVEVKAHVGDVLTIVTLTIVDSVSIVGTPGALEFKRRDGSEPT